MNRIRQWLALAALALPLPAMATGLLVPAYFYPNAAGTNFWSQLPAAASAAPLRAILNPNNGPGSSTDTQYVNAIAQVHAAGGKIIGYVFTNYGNRAASLVHADVDSYFTLYSVDGIFIDEMSNLAGDVAYYASLYNYIKGKNAAWSVVGNPGTNTLEDYVKAATRGADTVVIYEDSAANFGSFTPETWTAAYSADCFAAIIHSQPAQGGMQGELSAPSMRNIGWVFVTDDVLSNPYDTLPAYWDNEVTAAAAGGASLGGGALGGGMGSGSSSGGGAFGAGGMLLAFLGLRKVKNSVTAPRKLVLSNIQ